MEPRSLARLASGPASAPGGRTGRVGVWHRVGKHQAGKAHEPQRVGNSPGGWEVTRARVGVVSTSSILIELLPERVFTSTIQFVNSVCRTLIKFY